ncbi:hypothetical protein HD806DRAFT_511978 [Xylariaceae sp. AK1471]|nr:hypothetical protein HD806DRAFT_511978 [Xylariaceae sp. AK1471]
MLETTFNWSSNFQKEGSVGPSLQDELSTESTVTDPMLATTLSWSSNFLELPPTPASVSSTSLGLVSPSQADSGTAWDIASLSMPLDPKLDNTVMETGTGLESFLSSPINFLDIETLSSFNFDLGHYDASGPVLSSTIGPVSDSEKSSVDHPITPKPATPPSNDTALPTADTPMSGLSESDCSCLLQALDLMKDLSQADLTVCNAGSMVSPTAQYTNCSDQRGNLSPRAVVLENKKAIQAISAMLRCSCSEDAYLLTLLSMIILKMLERYALAVQNHSKLRSEDSSSNDTSRATYSISPSRVHSPHNGGPGRIAIQLILSELHHIQGLVNQLSPKMKLRSLGPAEGAGGTDKKETSHKDHQASTASTFSNNDPLLPFSTTTMNRIEMDIRQSLSTLSSGIIKVLRHS